jgi:hypothetical protein
MSAVSRGIGLYAFARGSSGSFFAGTTIRECYHKHAIYIATMHK